MPSEQPARNRIHPLLLLHGTTLCNNKELPDSLSIIEILLNFCTCRSQLALPQKPLAAPSTDELVSYFSRICCRSRFAPRHCNTATPGEKWRQLSHGLCCNRCSFGRAAGMLGTAPPPLVVPPAGLLRSGYQSEVSFLVFDHPAIVASAEGLHS